MVTRGCDNDIGEDLLIYFSNEDTINDKHGGRSKTEVLFRHILTYVEKTVLNFTLKTYNSDEGRGTLHLKTPYRLFLQRDL